MSDLDLPTAKRLALIEQADRDRRLADAKVDVARRALLVDEELLPLLRDRLDAWRYWGETLGPSPGPGGDMSQASDRQSDAQYKAREKARRLRWDVTEDAYHAYRARDEVDKLTLAGALRLAPADNGPPPKPAPVTGPPLRIAYADPPYPGQAKRLYGNHPDYAGEVDHAALVEHLETYDGWCLHTSSPALRDVLPLCPPDARVMAWVKPWAAFKRNIPVAYAWEPVLVKACRTPRVTGREVMRDWIAESITLERGLAGAKPARVCWWLFEVLGMGTDDHLDDLFPGTGAVTRAWKDWRSEVVRTEA